MRQSREDRDCASTIPEAKPQPRLGRRALPLQRRRDADAINELIKEAHSALRNPLRACLKPTLTGRAAKLPLRLFWAPSTAESCRT